MIVQSVQYANNRDKLCEESDNWIHFMIGCRIFEDYPNKEAARLR